MIDNKNTFPFILSQFSQYLRGQILFAVPLKIVLSQTKFVKRWQTIRTKVLLNIDDDRKFV